MNIELADIVEKYTKIFPADFSFECLGGWSGIIDVLCQRLQDRTDLYEDPQVQAMQIKEKFGTLRFYVDQASEIQFTLIDETEEHSAQVCDVCGARAHLRNDGWMMTRCDQHAASG